MEIILKVFAGLVCLFGIIVTLISASKNFDHKGMALSGISYLIGGVASLYFNLWWPLVIGVVLSILIRKIFGEPDYSKTSSINEQKSTYQLWCEKYKPIMGTDEPINYITTLNKFTDMTAIEKDEYLKDKIDNKLFWSVIDIGNNKLKIQAGKHETDVIAWWFCDIPYSNTAEDIEISSDFTN